MTFHRGPVRTQSRSRRNLRIMLALPLIVVAVVLFMLSAVALFFVDWITGLPLSRNLIG